MNSSFKIGTISGIRIAVHPTWLIAIIFIAWTIASLFERTFPSWSTTQNWTGAIVGALALFGSVLVHELAHSIVAQRLGLPVEGITLFIFGGVSQISGKYKRARDEFLVAFAGPLSSLMLGALFALLWVVLKPESGDPSLILGIVYYLGFMNILLGIFNMLPGFPLDGGRVLRSIVWGWSHSESTATRVAAGVGSLVAWGMIGVGIYLFLNGEIGQGIWIVFIGLFLQSASRGERQAERVTRVTAYVPLRSAIQRTPRIVEADERVSDIMNDVADRWFEQVVPVVDDGVPIGFFTVEDTARFSIQDRVNLSVGSVISRHQPYAVQTSHNAVEVLEALRARGQRYALVLDEDDVVGVVGVPGLEAVIRLTTPGADASAERPSV
jgi:Zn-dependent protease/predicted transcriptional regulator